MNPAKRKTAQLRLTKDRLKVEKVTLQKLEEWLRTTQGSITGTERFHLIFTASFKWIIHPTIEEPFKGMLGSSPRPALSAAAAGIPCHNHWVRLRHGFLKKGNDSISNKCSCVGGNYTLPKRQALLQTTLATLKHFLIPWHTPDDYERCRGLPSEHSSFPCAHAWRTAPNPDKSLTRGPMIIWNALCSPCLATAGNKCVWVIFIHSWSNRLERTDWLLQRFPQALRYRRTKYSGANMNLDALSKEVKY